ncbi:hypothetical protein NB694_000317 [Pantoea ananatis]|uniref:replication protein P n=1 Tax=Pantoea ananas TaxID=553 RepID=UPI0021F79076|nr:replication protein P [Pantoea ananatis]MCW0310517.1 hypothetical protein [Pantoea ananatis]
MKSIAEQMVNLERKNMKRVANGLAEIQDDAPQQAEQVAEIFNTLFGQLRAAFPAAMANLRTQEELNEFRRQWLLSFRENGITTMAQVNAGMRAARKQEKPFLPSPGQFVAWCRDGKGALGITAAEVLKEFWHWRRTVFRYPTSEQYPWTQAVMYQICLELRRRSNDRQLTEPELLAEAKKLIQYWDDRVTEGKPVPPIRKALSAPAQDSGPTPAEILKAEYLRRKGMV